jgi:hypothetical protein
MKLFIRVQSDMPYHQAMQALAAHCKHILTSIFSREIYQQINTSTDTRSNRLQNGCHSWAVATPWIRSEGNAEIYPGKGRYPAAMRVVD